MSESLKEDVTEKDFHTFLEISVFLTGFNKNELLSTGMHETYYYTIMKESDQEVVRAFFNESQSILDRNIDNESLLVKEIKLKLIPESEFKSLARRIILLWYTGIWTTIKLTTTEEISISEMVNAESYKQGLIWAAAQINPIGTRHPGFGSWSKPPL